jgi:hypothetical protein
MLPNTNSASWGWGQLLGEVFEVTCKNSISRVDLTILVILDLEDHPSICCKAVDSHQDLPRKLHEKRLSFSFYFTEVKHKACPSLP